MSLGPLLIPLFSLFQTHGYDSRLFHFFLLINLLFKEENVALFIPTDKFIEKDTGNCLLQVS